MSSEMPNPNDYFEEFTGKLLRKLGCRIEREPPVGNGLADFHATTPDNDEFYVEATVAEHRPFSNKPTEADVCDKLNDMCSNPGMYCFNAHAQGELSQKLSKKTLLPIKEWIEELSTTEVKRITQTFSYRNETLTIEARDLSTGWTLTINARPRSEDYQGTHAPLLGGIGGGGAVDSAKPLLTAAKAKLRQHKDIPGPLLLAINDFGDFPSERIDVTLALFGWEQGVEKGLSRISSPSVRRQRSLWGNRENTTVSAILLFHELTPRALPHAKVCLYENPWAKYPIPSLLRTSFPHALVEEKQGIQYLRWYPGPRLSSISGYSSRTSTPRRT